MKLTKIKLGELIEQVDERNKSDKYDSISVRGISTLKKFIQTKANLNGVSLTSYKIVEPGYFAYVPDTSRRGNKISLAYNNSNDTFIVSSISIVFRVCSDLLLPEYLYLFFNRPEFDRYSRYNSWGSAREPFNYSDMCDIDFELPEIDIQKKYVKIFDSINNNYNLFESYNLELKELCESYLEKIKKNEKNERIGKYIELNKETNSDNAYTAKDVIEVSSENIIIPTKANVLKNDLSKFILVKKNDFVYNPRNAVAIAKSDYNKTKLISWNNTAFHIKDEFKNTLMPEFLFMFFARNEYARWAKFNSWGSSTEVLAFDDICEYSIPIPSIKEQESIVKLYHVYMERNNILKKIDEIRKSICPILIRGAIKEANNE